MSADSKEHRHSFGTEDSSQGYIVGTSITSPASIVAVGSQSTISITSLFVKFIRFKFVAMPIRSLTSGRVLPMYCKTSHPFRDQIRTVNVLYYYDPVFTNLFTFLAEMAEIFLLI